MLGRATTEPTDEEREFLRRRVALFGLMTATVGFAFLGFRVALALALAPDPDQIIDPSIWAHLVGASLVGLVWLLTRRGDLSTRFIHAVETFGLIGSCTAYTVMGAQLRWTDHPELIVVLAMTYGLVTRAVTVPSSARRTLLLGLAIGVPLLVVIGAAAAGATREEFVALGADPDAPIKAALVVTVYTAAWWAMTVFVATATTRVIYGLRREVRDTRKLGQYTLEEKLGEGGMGIVYRASHALLRRPTAVKLLLPERTGEADLVRFEREVQLTASLTHPNTVTIFDYGRTPDGILYYAMELLDGATLEEVVLIDGAQPASRVIHVLAQVAGALAEAHGVGLIHRDVKPGNIVLCRRGGESDIAKVVDFGLVKELRGGEAALTAANTITGTPQYMAPEMISAPESVDARSDIYALGAVGYYLVTGEHVFTGKNIVEICGHHLHSEPTPPSERLGAPVPEALERVLLDCLAKEPERRPPTAIDVRDRLVACRQPPWTEAQAAAWWQQHEQDVRTLRQKRLSMAGTGTLAVDLGQRLKARPTTTTKRAGKRN